MDEPQEIACRLLIPGRHPAILLDPVDETLRQIPLLIKMFVIITLENAILLRRDHRLRPTRLDRRNKFISIISFICNHCFGIMTFDQRLALLDVGPLAARQDELDRVSQAVDRDVQLGPEAASRASQRLIDAPFFAAPAACWWARITVLSRISHSKSGSF